MLQLTVDFHIRLLKKKFLLNSNRKFAFDSKHFNLNFSVKLLRVVLLKLF